MKRYQRIRTELLANARRHAPWKVFLYICTRLQLSPFDRVIDHVPENGTVLDVGCGYGSLLQVLYFAGRRHPLMGTDIDHEKLRIAQQFNPAPEHIRYITDINAEAPKGSLSAIILCDVLYLLPDEEKKALVQSLLPYLGHNGALLIKTTNPGKKLKFWWTYFQEVLAVKVLGWTKTEHTRLAFIRDLDEFCGFLESLGLAVEQYPIDQGYFYPHILLVGKK